MATPSRVGSETTFTDTTGTLTPAKTVRLSHTTTADTDLLIFAVFHRENDSWGTDPATFDSTVMTLIAEKNDSTSSGDVAVRVYGLISPGAKTADCDFLFSNSPNPTAGICINYTDVDTASVAAATNHLTGSGSPYSDNTGSGTTVVFTSGGSSGNQLLAFAVGAGDDSGPMTNDDSFTEIWDAETGGGAGSSADLAVYAAEKAAASGITINVAGS